MSAYSPKATDSSALVRKKMVAALAAIADNETGYANLLPAYAANNQDQPQETERRALAALAAIADVRATKSSFFFVAAGDATTQTALVGTTTTNVTATDLTTNGAVSAAGNRIPLASNVILSARISITGSTAGGAVVGHYVREVAIRNTGGTVSLVGSVGTIGTDITDSGASSWAVAVTADNVNKALKVTVTGAASTTIQWLARIESTAIKF